MTLFLNIFSDKNHTLGAVSTTLNVSTPCPLRLGEISGVPGTLAAKLPEVQRRA